MASDARPTTVRWVALAAVTTVVLGAAGVLVWTDDLGSSAARPLWDRATGDARILLLFEGPLVVVVGAIVAVIAVALVAWHRDRSRSARTDPPSSLVTVAMPAQRPSAELLGAWRRSGRLGLVFATLVASGACFAVYGTVESIWGEPSVRLSLLTFGGAAVAAAAVAGPVVGAGSADKGVGVDRRGLRHATVVLLATLVLGALVVPTVNSSTALSLGQAVRLLASADEATRAEPEHPDYVTRLFASGLGLIKTDGVSTTEFGLVILLERDGGFDDDDEDDLQRAARMLGLRESAALVHRGLGLLVTGAVDGLASPSGEDQRDRVREVLDG
ncbi:MAG: hypothetical protein M3Z03_15710 [Actinomycetota bacterium]|nr:hypothetical protein [Actinomycetota bacterium]